MVERYRKGHPPGGLNPGVGVCPRTNLHTSSTVYTHTEAMAEEPTVKPWGPATPVWMREAIGTDERLRKAIDDCLTEQGHPDEMELFPAATDTLSRTTPNEIDALVEQGCT